MRKETRSKNKDWSAFAADFEQRSAYVVGQADLDVVGTELAKHAGFGIALELGCGAGVYTKVLAEGSDELIATDISDEMVSVSAGRFKDRNHVTIEQADCYNLKYADACFDTVFMANLLHVIQEPEKAVAESFRVLKPGGRIIISSLTGYGMKSFDKMRMAVRYLRTWGKPPKGGSIMTVPKLRQMLTDSGFTICSGVLIGCRSKSVFAIGEK